jgi:hypothetical protein
MKRARPIVPAATFALQRLLHHARSLIPAAARSGRRDQAQLRRRLSVCR